MKWVFTLIFVFLLVAMTCVNWGGHKGPAIKVIGSTSVQPFAEMLAETYDAQQTAFVVDVQGGGSTVGLQAARDRYADVGMCSRELKGEEKTQFNATVIARDGLAIVAHPSNPVADLKRDQIRRMFNGEITNWNQVGGEDKPIRLIVREESSGTREAFMKMVMGKDRVSRKAINQDSNGAIKELVKDDPCAIGFMSLGLVTSELKALRVDGVEATIQAVIDHRYPLVRPFLFVTIGNPSEDAQKFIDYVLSDEAQRALEKEGLVRAK